MGIDELVRESARAIVVDMASLRKGHNVLVISGLHNRMFAEQIQLECYRIGAYPYLWVFDEKFFLKHAKRFAQNTVAVLPKHVGSLLESSDVVIWLSQFEDLEEFPNGARRAMVSFWDFVYVRIENKPRLIVNLISPKWIKSMGIPYSKFFQSFADAVRVDYSKLQKIGKAIVSRLDGKKQIHVYDSNDTDVAFSIKGRRVGVEVGTLESCFSSGEECEVEVPSGEVYVAPLETSANGILVVDEFRDYAIHGLELMFKEGKVSSFKAEKGGSVFKELLEKATGDKDRIAVRHRHKLWHEAYWL